MHRHRGKEIGAVAFSCCLVLERWELLRVGYLGLARAGNVIRAVSSYVPPTTVRR